MVLRMQCTVIFNKMNLGFALGSMLLKRTNNSKRKNCIYLKNKKMLKSYLLCMYFEIK